ncbi:hypothetical protein CBL_04126 [Carabus blaptoides fortunei]
MSGNRKRRSSILKPQKMRNPLSDINIEQPMETTFMRQSRRVSFASSNFIKEFTADPEKNTIWHMSYEEAAISTDNNSSALIAQEVIPVNSEANVPEDMSLTDSDEFNCTKICSFDNSVEEEHIGANELEIAHSGSQIELCTVLGDCNKTTDIYFKQDPVQFCEIVNEQKIQDNITDLKLQNLQFNETLGFANVNMLQPNLPSFIMGQENNCSIRGQLCRTALHDVMDMTQSVPLVTTVDRSENTEVTKRRTIHFSQQSNDCDMDVTQSVPTYIDMSNKGNASQFKRQTINFNQCSNDNNMDMTHGIPIGTETDKENMLKPKHQIMHFNQVSNYGDMEISQSIPEAMKIINKENSTNRRTLHYNQATDNGDMEITQIFNKENIPNVKHQYMHFNQTANDGDMEMTQSLPAEMKTINNKNVCSINREHNSSTKRQTLHFSQTENGGDMEMTQSIPPGMKIINKEHISNMNGEQASNTKRQTIHFNQIANGGNMEMTQSIPPGMKIINKEHISNINGEQGFCTKRQTIHFNQIANGGNMEMTQSIPPGMKITKEEHISNMNEKQASSTKRQTIHFNQAANGSDMEMTQSISTGMKIVNKENDPNIKRQSIHYNHIANDDYMEMTQAIPAGVKIANEENVQRTKVCNVKRQMIQFNEAKRQTIHFNQTADHGNMDVTQAIPQGVKIINKENTSCTMKENVSNTKRQTIHFSEIEHDNNMVMTQSIPAIMKIMSRGNISSTKRKTIHFNQATTDTGDMEMTQAVPAGMKIVGQENITNTKRQILDFNQTTDTDNIELTKAIPAGMKIVDKENITNTKRQTIHFNQATDTGNMEMTQAIPVGMKMVSKSNVPNTKRQTIHFNQCTGDMEMTQLIPAGMEIINKESVPRENASNTKRQTINFNQISNDGNMEITLDIPTENTENEKIITQDMHVGLKTKFAHVSNLNCQTVNISQISHDFVTTKSGSVDLIPIHNEISQITPSANKLSGQLNSILGSEMNTTKSNYYLDEIIKSAPSGSRILQKRENLFTKALLLDDESKFTDCNAELAKSYSGNDISNANNIIDTQQQRRPTQTVLLNADILENNEQIEHAASNTLQDQYIHNEKREVPFHLKRQAMLMNSNKKVLENASMNEDICIRIRYPNQSNDCLSFNSSKMNLTPARCISEQTTFNLSKNLSSYIDNTERLINYKTDGNPTSDYSKIINDDLNLSVLKSNVSENNRQDICYNKQNCFVNEVNIFDDNGIDVTERSNLEHNTSVDDVKEENCHQSEKVCKVGHKRLSDEMIDNVSEIAHKIDRILDVPGGIVNIPNNTINIDERIDITDIVDCENNDDKNDSVVLVNSSSESECDLSNEKKDISGLDASCSGAKISVPSNFANLTSNATNVSPSCENTLKSFDGKSAPHSETIQCEIVSLIESVSSDSSDDSESECDLAKNDSNDTELDIFHAKVSIPPNIPNLIPNESWENSLKSFVEKSILHSETLLCESVSLIDSVSSDCSDDFAAVSFGAKQVKKLINKSVVDSALTEGVENIDVSKSNEIHFIINRVKTSLEKICPDVNPDIPVEFVEEKSMEMPIVKKSNTLKQRFCKLFKNPLTFDESDKKELILEEKIKEKSKDTLWNIVQLQNEHFTFTFMYDTIDFRVNIDRDTEIVKTAEFFSRFCESTSHPSAIFVHRILKKKLSQNHIKSACGQKYNILSLLDYITILGEQMRDILNEFDDLELKYGLIIDSDLNATFCPTNLFLRIAFEVTINLSNIDNVSEMEINVKTLVGNIRELEVKRLAKGCPQGLPFLRAYILSIEEYLRFLQNTKQSRIRK